MLHSRIIIGSRIIKQNIILFYKNPQFWTLHGLLRDNLPSRNNPKPAKFYTKFKPVNYRTQSILRYFSQSTLKSRNQAQRPELQSSSNK
jgi:hypothetical protein